MNDLPTRPISPPERQAAVDRLCAHFAADHLPTDEFERRLDLAYAASSSQELVALERDLPALTPEDGEGVVPSRPTLPSAPVDAKRAPPERDFMLSVMGGTERTGTWVPARNMTMLALMGGGTLDFREATFASREVRVTLFLIMGGAEVIVPPGVHVEWNGVAIMGGLGSGARSTPDPDAPVIRINGLVMMGGVSVSERLPGESEREAKKRIKAEKKAAKRARLSSGSDG